MAVLYTPHFIQFIDNTGAPLSGGKLWTYAAGTTTPKATYTMAAGTVENTNPVVLDAYGRAVVFIDGAYKFTLTDSSDVVIRTVDNVTSFTALDSAADPFFESFSGNGTQTAFTVSEDLGTDEKTIFVWVDSGLQEHATNGTFTTDTGWTKGTGWSIGAGVATATGAISTAIEQTSAVTMVQGQSYNVTVTVNRSNGGIIPSIGGKAGTERTTSATFTETIIAGSTQVIAFTGNGFTGTIDNVIVTPAVGKGFQILPPTAYTNNGTSLTFNTAPAIGTNNILVNAPLLSVGAASSSAAAAQAAEAGALAAQVAAEAAAAALRGTSTSSVAIGTGSKAFTTQSGKQFDVGTWLLIASEADETNYMHGQVTAYSGTSLTVNVTNTGGSGTLADWDISVSGTRGATGATGTINDLTGVPTATIASGDYMIFTDVNDSNLTKRDTVTNIFNNAPNATDTTKGVVELATDGEVKTGTDTARAVTPANIKNQLGFSAYFESAGQTITSSGTLTIAHGLGRKPIFVVSLIKCTSAEHNYSVGQELFVPWSLDGADVNGCNSNCVPDATNLNIIFGSASYTFSGLNRTTGAQVSFTNANWSYIVRAWA